MIFTVWFGDASNLLCWVHTYIHTHMHTCIHAWACVGCLHRQAGLSVSWGKCSIEISLSNSWVVMRVENREWMRVRGDNNCVSADQYALTGSISAVPVRSLDEQPKPKRIVNSDSRGSLGSDPSDDSRPDWTLQSPELLESHRYFCKGCNAIATVQLRQHFHDLLTCESGKLSQS